MSLGRRDRWRPSGFFTPDFQLCFEQRPFGRRQVIQTVQGSVSSKDTCTFLRITSPRTTLCERIVSFYTRV